MSIFRKTTEFFFGKKKNIVNITTTVPLQAYLDKYYKATLAAGKLGAQPADDSTAKLHVPISIFAHARTGTTHTYAGIHGDEMHFSASLLKVAPMFAAFKLRAEARKFAETSGITSPAAFIPAFKLQFHSTDAVPEIISAGPSVGLEPRYADILSVTASGGSAPVTVNFAPSFYHSLAEDHALFKDYEDIRTAHGLGDDADGNPIEDAASSAALARVSHMYKMIVISNNSSAGECIRRLGYAYINVKLKNEGLFVPGASRAAHRGIWVGGDYTGATRVELPSVNDGDVALSTTSRQMARFFSLIRLKKLIPDTESSNGMEELLQEAQRVDTSWLSLNWNRDTVVTRLFKVDAVKVGVANLKPNTPPKGPNVYSEGIIARWLGDAADLVKRNLNGDLAICWQNLLAGSIGSHFDGIAEVIEKSFHDFVKQLPI